MAIPLPGAIAPDRFKEPTYAAIMGAVNEWIEGDLPSVLGRGPVAQPLSGIGASLPLGGTEAEARQCVDDMFFRAKGNGCADIIRGYVHFRLAAANTEIVFTQEEVNAGIVQSKNKLIMALKEPGEEVTDRPELFNLAESILKQIDSILIEKGVNLSVNKSPNKS